MELSNLFSPLLLLFWSSSSRAFIVWVASPSSNVSLGGWILWPKRGEKSWRRQGWRKRLHLCVPWKPWKLCRPLYLPEVLYLLHRWCCSSKLLSKWTLLGWWKEVSLLHITTAANVHRIPIWDKRTSDKSSLSKARLFFCCSLVYVLDLDVYVNNSHSWCWCGNCSNLFS